MHLFYSARNWMAALVLVALAACGGPAAIKPETMPAAVPPAAVEIPATDQTEAASAPAGEEVLGDTPLIGTIDPIPPLERMPLELSPEAAEPLVPRPSCRLASDPMACEKRQRVSERALAECQGIDPRLKGDCMRDAMVRNEDCTQSRAVSLCEARKYAYETCYGTYSKERRQCLLDAMPLSDCTRSSTPDRCEASKVALQNCAVFVDGTERRACLYQELAPFMVEDVKKPE